MKRLAELFVLVWIFALAPAAPQLWSDDGYLPPPIPAAQTQPHSDTIAAAPDSRSGGATPQSHPPASSSNPAHRLSRFFAAWFRMGERVQAQQPGWLSPLVTTSGRVKQEFRYDFSQQPASPGSNYNFGGGKGLEFIVAPRVELLLGPPAYTAHFGPPGSSASSARGGFADIPLMLKVRVASAPDREGNYLVTLLLSATVPGGPNSMCAATVSPGIALGKGWGNFDVQSALTATLPVGDTELLGRELLSSTAFQYHTRGKLWPEVEVNSTSFFAGGKDAGNTQLFLTPGLGFGRVRIWRALRFSAGAGMQLAVTHFHTYNHRAVFSTRFSF